MKNKKELLAGIVAFLLIGVQAYYFYSIHPIKISELEMTQSEVSTKKKQLETLKQQYARLEETKEELEVTKLQVTATKAQLPTYFTASKDMVDMIRLMENGSFSNLEVKVGSEQRQVLAEKEVLGMNYQMSFITPFSKVKRVIENLKQSYQIIKIHSLAINNGPQANEQEYEKLYADKMHELVQVQIDFSIFARVGEDNEIYEPTANTLTNPEEAFKSREAENIKKQQAVTDASKPSEKTHRPDLEGNSTVDSSSKTKKNDFELLIYDILTSGDTHRLLSPNDQGEDNYTGAIAEGDTKITFNVWEDHYTIQIYLADGTTKEIQGKTLRVPVSFKVTSYAKPVDGKVARTDIYINNYTKDNMLIEVNGKNAGNIHIYNEAEQEVQKGEKKGKIKVY